MAERPLSEQLDQLIESWFSGAAPPNVPPGLEALAEVADVLRHLPSQDFKERLKTELQRSMSMSAATEIRAAFRTVSPFIIHERAPELVEFLKRAFSAEEVRRDTTEQAYGFYAEVRTGDSMLMIGGGSAAERGNLPGAFHVFVEDCDAAYHRALEAGATTLMGAMGEPADRPYGERSAFVEDAFGNYWYIATRFSSGTGREDPAMDAGSLLPYLHPEGARKHIAFLKAAFGAEELAVIEHAGRVVHATVRIGDAVLEMGEPESREGIPAGGFFVRVDDVETAYAKALAAGGTVIRPPQDIPYGYRTAIVRDSAGFMWWMARLLTR
jgi:PhnB protein